MNRDNVNKDTGGSSQNIRFFVDIRTMILEREFGNID